MIPDKQEDDSYTDGMEMPTPCESCGQWSDLHDMVGSDKWYRDIVICRECGELEDEEIELDDDIENEQNTLSDAEWQVKESTKELERLRVKRVELESKIEDQRSDKYKMK